MKFPYNFLVIFCLISFNYSQFDNSLNELPESISLVEENDLNMTLKYNQVAYFQYHINIKVNKFDLTIFADPLDQTSDPDIYVSKSNKYPNATNNSDIWANSYGYDMLTIPSNHLENNSTLYIGIKCASDECNFSVKVKYTSEYYMKIGHSLRLFYQETSAEVIRINIPMDSVNISHIIIYAELMNPESISKPFHFYLKKGNQIPSSSDYSIASEASWLDGKAAIIYSDSIYFCTGCNYTILVQAQKNSRIQITGQLYSSLMVIYPNKLIKDGLKTQKKLSYQMFLNQTKNFEIEDLIIDLSPYYGYSQLFVEFDNIPENLSNYRWNATQHGKKRLIITPEERKEYGVENSSVLYITLFGKTACTYSLKVLTSGVIDNQIILSETQTGYILNNEIVNYVFETQGSINQNVTATVSSSIGANITLFAKSCYEKQTCQILQSDIESLMNGTTQSNNKYPVATYADQSGQITVLKFLHEGSLCSKNENFLSFDFASLNMCHYAIAVVSFGPFSTNESSSIEKNPEYETPLVNNIATKYTLRLEMDKTLIKLAENAILRGHIELDNYDYYVFTLVEDDPSILSISFQATSISGAVTLYSSRTNQFPNIENNDKRSFYQDLITYEKDLEEEEDIELSGNYYISVKGIDTSSYTITTLIKRQNNTESGPITLIEGIPQKIILKENEIGYAQFIIDLDNKRDHSIEIFLTDIQGKFNFYIRNDGIIPTNTSYTWGTKYKNNYYTNNKIEIYLDDEELSNENFTNIFIIAIYPNKLAKTLNNLDYICMITYIDENNIYTLQPEIPFYDFISINHTMHFVLEVTPDDIEINLVKMIYDDNFDIYISNMKQNPFPNIDNYNFTTLNSYSNILNISNENVLNLCNWNINQTMYARWKHPICYLSVSACTNNTNSIFYSILYKKKSNYIMMREGLKFDLEYPKKGEYTKLYYFPYNSNNLYIIIDTIYQSLKVYASVIDGNGYNNKSEWIFPSNNNYTKMLDTEKNHKAAGNEIILKKKDFISCSSEYFSSCLVLISVTQNENSKFYQSIDEERSDYLRPTFSIVVTSEVTPITPGVPIYSSVQKSEYRYFSLRVTVPDCKILINLIPLSNGNPYLFVSFGENSRPTITSSKFSITYSESDIIQIGPDDLIDRKTMDGVWIIGIYGFEVCNFELVVFYEDAKIIELRDSIPFDFDVDATQKIHFNYFNFLNRNFTIKITRYSGNATVYINTLDYKKDFVSQLPNSQNYTWLLDVSKAQNLLILNTYSTGFCSLCNYLLTLEAESWTKASIVIQLQDEFTILSPGKTVRGYISPGANEKYEFFSFESLKIIDLNLIIYSGSPRIYVHHNRLVNESEYIWSYIPNPDQNTINLKLTPQNELNYEKLIWDGFEFIESYPDIYYIMIISSSESNYTLYYTTSNSNSILLDGILIYGSLFPNESNSYSYRSYIDSNEDFNTTKKTFKISLNIYDDLMLLNENQYTNEFDDIILCPQLTIDYISWDGFLKQDNISYVRDFRTQSTSNNNLIKYSEIINIPGFSGIYMINITNNNTNKPINYSFVINQKDILLIPPNTMHMSRLTLKDEDIYEIYVNQSGIIAIEVFECLGKVVLSAANTYEKLQNKEFDLQVKKSTPNGLYGKLIIDSPGSIYLSIRAISGYILEEIIGSDVGIKEALYKIQTKVFTTENEFPYDYFILGDQNKLKYSKIHDNTYKISWEDSTIDPDDSENLQNYIIKYNYKLIITQDELFADSLAKCNYKPSHLTGEFSNRSHYSHLILNLYPNQNTEEPAKKDYEIDLEDDGIYYIGLVNYISGFNKQNNDRLVWNFPVIYEAVELIKQSKMVNEIEKSTYSGEEYVMEFLIAACLLGFIIIIIILILLYRRYKRIVKRLNYEMQDVRNIGSIVSTINVEEIPDDKVVDREKAKYTGLLEEKTS